ncbi:MAG: phage integrase SAM-like domain-containing protein [Ferruginibacter sp.]
MSIVKQAINAEKKKGITISFELRKNKTNKKGLAPIRLIFQIRQQRKFHSIGQSILPQCWDNEKQEAIYIDKKTAKKTHPAIDYDLFFLESEVIEFNRTLFDKIQATKKITDRFILDKVAFTAEMVIFKLNGELKPTTKKAEPTNLLFDYIDKYIKDNKATRQAGSLTVYRSMKNHLLAYQNETKKKVTFDKIDYSFFQSFQNFLIGRTKEIKSTGATVPMLNNTTIAKQLSTIKTFLNYAAREGIEVSDKYKGFKISKEKLEVIALTNDEFENLYYLDLSNNERLAKVRDIFCFSCCTGFRYSDLKQLSRTHIKDEEIILTTIKTNMELNVPLTPLSKAILAKYKAKRKPLPMITNQRLNLYLKELCQLAGINDEIEIVRYRGVKRDAIIYKKYEKIGVHCGRKTFATLSLEKGMSTQQVMAIGGWEDYKSFARYVHVTNKLKSVAMAKAWGGDLKEPKLKAV